MKTRRVAALVLCSLLLLGALPTRTANAAPTFTTPSVYWVGCLSGTSLKVYWNASTGATGIMYFVERSTTNLPGSWVIVKNSTTSTQFTNYSLSTGTLYYYRVTAYREIVPGVIAQSPPSNVMGGVPLAKTSSFTVKPSSTTKLKLNWAAVPYANGYQVFRGTNKTGPFTYVASTTALYTYNTVTPGTFYYYFVWAYKTVGSNKYQGAPRGAEGITFAKPVINSITASGSSGAKIAWGSVAGATGYELVRRKGSTGSFAKVYIGTAKSFTDSGLVKGVTYYYKVRAYKRVSGTNYYGLYGTVKSFKLP